jgi:hypothetical protein
VQLPSGTYTLTVERYQGAAGGEWSAWAGAAGAVTLQNGASHLAGRSSARDTVWGFASGSFSAEGSSDRRDVSVSWNHLGEVAEMTWACTRCTGVRVLRAQVSCHGQRLVLAAERSWQSRLVTAASSEPSERIEMEWTLLY